MIGPTVVTVRVALPEDEAHALAQFLKRAGVSDYRRLAADEAEAYAMRDGAERLREALAAIGIAPR